MKKTLLAVFAAGLLIATPSCKKGENDPALSLSSRKSRLAGEWVLSSYEETSTNVNGSVTETETESFDGTNITSTWTTVDNGETTQGVGTSTRTIQLADYTINKDGTWESNWNATTVSYDTSSVFGIITSTSVNTTVSTSTVKGSWSFIGKAKGNYKNKERVALSYTSSYDTHQTTSVTTITGSTAGDPVVGDTYVNDNTYGINEETLIYDIDMLKGKEMTWVSLESGTNSWSQTDNAGVSVTSSGTSEGSKTMKLTAK